MNTLEQRFWSNVSFARGARGCWLWTGVTVAGGNGNATSYGQFCIGKGKVMAHRFAYSVRVGEVPAGLDLDHVKARGCLYRACVNHSHLEPVTRRENVKRGRGPAILARRNGSKTACPDGHPYDALSNKGIRQCKRCRAAGSRRWRAAQKNPTT